MVNARPKRKARSDKFPLTLHPTGQYCKKIKGKLYYFGNNKQKAHQQYLEQAVCLHAGKPRNNHEYKDSMSIKTLCNLYLEHQKSRVQSREIKLGQVYDQTIVLRDFARFIGRNTAVSEISTIDLQNYRARLIKQGKSAARINNHISAFKAMYHWTAQNELIDTIPNLDAIKKLPRPTKSKPIFAPKEIISLLGCADLKMTALIWLGLNCGFGSTDCAELLWEHVDLKAGRVVFPRTKTGIARNLPLWQETIYALKKLPKINERVFNTDNNERIVRFVERTLSDGSIKIVKYDNVGKEFSRVIKSAGIQKEKGVGFYTLRRTAATLAAQSGDPFAVQRLLGHADLKMATTYVQDISEQTDRVINNSRKLICQDDS